MKISDAEPNDTREQYNLAYGYCVRHYKISWYLLIQ